jgi:hypothetical protein
MKKDYIIWTAIILLDIVLVFFVPNTFDNGDSIKHYIEAHQAWHTPHYFLDMWSKPIFILLASPFASLGWWGMKLFNIICVLLSSFLMKKIFEEYDLNGWWGVFMSLLAHTFFLSQSSGLTEPLFAVSLAAIVYLEIKNRSMIAMLLLSFLPFIRSEGYIVALVILVYLLFTKKLKYIPYLLVGHLIYGIIGLFALGDFLWMFHENPYAGIELKYGSGDILHFINQLPFVVGLPIYVLFFLGVIHGGIRFFKGKMEVKEFILIYGITIGYIAAHSIFWRYGLFHSFGLSRVLIAIIPLMSFIAYRGLEWLVCSLYFIPKKYIYFTFILVIAGFPFIKNKMAIDWEKDIELSAEQKLIQDANTWLVEHPDIHSKPIYTNLFYYAQVSDKLIDNDKQVHTIDLLKQPSHTPKSGAFILWDSYFAPTDAEVDKPLLEKTLEAQEIKRFTNTDGFQLVIYQLP